MITIVNDLGKKTGGTMGGMESGIQYWLGKKTTTEECRSLDVNELARDSVFRVGSKGVNNVQKT